MKGQIPINYLIILILTLVVLALVMSINNGFVTNIMENSLSAT